MQDYKFHSDAAKKAIEALPGFDKLPKAGETVPYVSDLARFCTKPLPQSLTEMKEYIGEDTPNWAHLNLMQAINRYQKPSTATRAATLELLLGNDYQYTYRKVTDSTGRPGIGVYQYDENSAKYGSADYVIFDETTGLILEKGWENRDKTVAIPGNVKAQDIRFYN